VEAHDPHNLHFGQSFERLVAFRPQLVKMETQERLDPNIVILSKLDQQRKSLFKIIHAIAKLFQQTPIDEISNQALCIITVITKYKKDIISVSHTDKTKHFYNLIADFKAQPEVMKSLKALSLTPLFVQMEKVNTEFERLFMQRSQHQKKNGKIEIRAVRLECDKAITLLWNAIEFCCNEYGEQDYLSLITDINDLNMYYKQQLTARIAKRKINKNGSDEIPIKPMK
jgi:hypothetical protein